MESLVKLNEPLLKLLSKKLFSLSIKESFHLLQVRIDRLEIKNALLAHLICTLVPASCPIERDIKFFGHQIVHIPALCQLNPFYDQLMHLRFRSLSYLANESPENISRYVSN